MTATTQTPAGVSRRHQNRAMRPQTRNSGRSDYAALAEYGIRHADAVRAVQNMRRELERRAGEMEKFLAMDEAEYNVLTDDGEDRRGVAALREIRGWFSGELEVACKALALDSYCVAERAAILEFNAGYSRRQAEIIAMRDALRDCRRYDDEVKAMVDDGLILDIARQYIDAMAAREIQNAR